MDTNNKTVSPGDQPGDVDSPNQPTPLTDAIATEAEVQADEPENEGFDEEIEEEEDWSALNPVDEQLLATMSENGNYESIVAHMKAGNVVPITKSMLSSLVVDFETLSAAQTKYDKLLSNLQYLVKALNPLLAERQQLQEYFDAESNYFVNIGKLLGEFLGVAPKLSMYFLNPMPKKGKLEIDTPLTRIFSKIDKSQFELFDLDSLLAAVEDSGVPTDDFMAFWEQIGGKKFFAKKEVTDGTE